VFEQQRIDRDLRVALTLKADDLWFTVGGERGRQLQAEFLGVAPLDGLAGETFDEAGLRQIDLSRFEIARHVADLAEAVGKRSWGPDAGVPDTEDQRIYNLEFVEHFLSTLPTVALGGLDSTSVGSGILRDLYLTSYAWFGLVDAVADAFRDENDHYSIELSDLARLSGRDLRTIRNQAGPAKPLRTTAQRRLRREAAINDPAFVRVNTFDAVDWLRRRGFEFQPLSLDWARSRIGEAQDPGTRTRSLLMLALVNGGPRTWISSTLTCSEDRVRSLEEAVEQLTATDEQRLQSALSF
jgi:hypothetical protein